MNLIIIILIIVLPRVSLSQTFEQPDTGWPSCYDENGSAASCFKEEDSRDDLIDMLWSDNRLTDNGDGTVTDTLTGLMWLKDGSCLGEKNWGSSLIAISDLNNNPKTHKCHDYTADYSDWRLPAIDELESLVKGIKSIEIRSWPDIATFLNSKGFINISSSRYWSSTTGEDNTDGIWCVYMWFAQVGYYLKIDRYYVLPIRDK